MSTATAPAMLPSAPVEQRRSHSSESFHRNKVNAKKNFKMQQRSLRMDSSMSATETLANMGDMYVRKIEVETHALGELEQRVTEAQHGLAKLQAFVKGVGKNAPMEVVKSKSKQLKSLENRLHKVQTKYSEALVDNGKVKEMIQNHRLHKQQNLKLCEKNYKSIKARKGQLAKLMKTFRSTNAELDSINASVDAVNQQIVAEKVAFEGEYKSKRADLEREINQLASETRKVAKVSGRGSTSPSKSPTASSQRLDVAKLEASVHTESDVNIDLESILGSLTLDQEAKIQKQAARLLISNKSKAEKLHALSERAQKTQDAFDEIRKATGLTEVPQITQMFVEAEREQFTLCKMNNELSQELEAIEHENNLLLSDISRLKTEEVSTSAGRERLERNTAIREKVVTGQARADALLAQKDEALAEIGKMKTGVLAMYARVVGAEGHHKVGQGGGHGGQPAFGEHSLLEYMSTIEERVHDAVMSHLAAYAKTNSMGFNHIAEIWQTKQHAVVLPPNTPEPGSCSMAHVLPLPGLGLSSQHKAFGTFSTEQIISHLPSAAEFEDGEGEDDDMGLGAHPRPFTYQELQEKSIQSFASIEEGMMRKSTQTGKKTSTAHIRKRTPSSMQGSLGGI